MGTGDEMKYIAMILAWLTPLLAALKYIGGFNISWPVILAPITPLFGFALLVLVVAIGAVLWDRIRPNTNDYR